MPGTSGTTRRTVWGAVVAAALLLTAACAEDDKGPDAPPGDGRAIEAYVNRSWPSGAGGTVMAARDGTMATCLGKGQADAAKNIPAGCDTVYDIGSLTKSFTAAAILRLEMDGKLRVTDPVGTHLGPMPQDKSAITLHQLLTHTSGLVESLGDDYEAVSRDTLLERARASALQSAPGKVYAYSNLGYSLLAAVVEQASGMSYPEFLRTRLFAPAGMTRTGYVLPAEARAQLAVEYDGKGVAQGTPLDHPWAPDGPHWNLRGNGGLLSTARDMFLWSTALQGDTVLDAAAKRKMFTPHVQERFEGEEGPASWYGYGWTIVQTGAGTLATHDGGNDWSFARYALLPDARAALFWATNTSQRGNDWNFEDEDGPLTKKLLGLLVDKADDIVEPDSGDGS